jgi:hypothetical protein
MTAITFIISVVALACGCAALIIAMRESKKQTRETIVRVEKAPVEHPFIYDDEKQCYTLDGSLEVTGSVTALKKGGKA